MSEANRLARRSTRYPVLLISITTVTVLAMLLLIRVPQAESLSPASLQSPKASLALQADLALRVTQLDAYLHDPEPLFLPTKVNSAYDVAPERKLQRPGESFGSVAPKMVFSSGALPLTMPAPVTLPETPAKELDHMGSERPFVGLGSRDLVPKSLASRRYCVEVSSMSNGLSVGRVDLAGVAEPLGAPWQPVQFMLLVNEYGQMTISGMLRSSGVARVDEVLSAILQRELAGLSLRMRIGPGLYRITVGP